MGKDIPVGNESSRAFQDLGLLLRLLGILERHLSAGERLALDQLGQLIIETSLRD
jgi:hypothetical protein